MIDGFDPVGDVVRYGNKQCTVKRVSINIGSGGEQTLLAAVAGKHTLVISALLRFSGAGDSIVRAGAAGTEQLRIVAAAGTTLTLGYQPVGIFKSGVNQALTIESNSGVTGQLVYAEVPA